MVAQIRTVERLRGTPEKHLTANEAKIQSFMRGRFAHGAKEPATPSTGAAR